MFLFRGDAGCDLMWTDGNSLVVSEEVLERETEGLNVPDGDIDERDLGSDRVWISVCDGEGGFEDAMWTEGLGLPFFGSEVPPFCYMWDAGICVRVATSN